MYIFHDLCGHSLVVRPDCCAFALLYCVVLYTEVTVGDVLEQFGCWMTCAFIWLGTKARDRLCKMCGISWLVAQILGLSRRTLSKLFFFWEECIVWGLRFLWRSSWGFSSFGMCNVIGSLVSDRSNGNTEGVLDPCRWRYYIYIYIYVYIYIAVLILLVSPSDLFHSWLFYPIFPGCSGTTSFFPSFSFRVDHNFWQSHWVHSLNMSIPY
jgi:hypothetical protein